MHIYHQIPQFTSILALFVTNSFLGVGSTDPSLIASSFTKASKPFFPEKRVPNVDVTRVPHGACKITRNQEINDRTFFSEMDCL